MGRVIIILIFVAGIWGYVNWQYHRVVRQVTSANTANSAFPAPAKTPWSQQRQESRVKCMICGGTGRSGFYTPGMNGRGGGSNTTPCSACRGTGWVDNPMYGH